jgi:hypothetical protein
VPPQISGNLKKVVDGIGTGSIGVEVLNPDLVKNNATYKIRFNSTGDFPKIITSTYDVIRTSDSKTDTLISKVNATEFGANRASPPFDGMTFTFKNDTIIRIVDSTTGWLIGKSNLGILVQADNSSPVNSVLYPCDYEIKFFDTEQFQTPFFGIPAYFKVRNQTINADVTAEIIDNDNSKTLSVGDFIVIIEYIGTQYKLVFDVILFPPQKPGDAPVMPKAGDIFNIKTTKPFRTGDYFSFSTKSSTVDNSQVKSELNKISVVPNPYIGAATWERRTLYQTGRGDRKIDFVHLPPKCTLRIYSMSGALIKTLSKDSAPGDGALSWDMVSDDGMDIAYGIYIYHVEVPGVGEHIGKFAVVK